MEFISPILYRTFYLLTPPSELPPLPADVRGWIGVHIYTMTQIIATAVIFIVTLTKGAPAFPIIIIAFVPIRLLLMNRLWARSTLRFVDAWACRPGRPEDEEEGGGGAAGDGEGKRNQNNDNRELNEKVKEAV
jgi:hypothetical protein